MLTLHIDTTTPLDITHWAHCVAGGVFTLHINTTPSPHMTLHIEEIGLVQWGIFTLHIDTTPHLTLHIEQIGLVGGVHITHRHHHPTWHYTLRKLGWCGGGIHIAHRYHPHPTRHYTLRKLDWWGVFTLHIDTTPLTLHIEKFGLGGVHIAHRHHPPLDITHWGNWGHGGLFTLHIDTTPPLDITHWGNWVAGGCWHCT